MIKALLLIFDPTATWEGIFRARRTVTSVLLIYLFPMLLLVAVVEGYGLVHWGKWQGEVGRLRKFPVGEAAIIEAAQFLLSVLVVFLGTKMIKSIGETFHGRHTYTQAFTAVAYGLSPFFLLRLLDAFTWASGWWGPYVPWFIGISLSISVLYHGVPRMMEPDPPNAFGLFLMSALLLALVTALVRFVTAAYLQGKFPDVQVIISNLGARLPF
jgi:Yip1 domain